MTDKTNQDKHRDDVYSRAAAKFYGWKAIVFVMLHDPARAAFFARQAARSAMADRAVIDESKREHIMEDA